MRASKTSLAYLYKDMLDRLLWNWGPWLYNQYVMRVEYYYTIYCTIYAALYSKKEWIFLKNNITPIPTQLFDITSISEDKIKWITTINPPSFVDPIYKHAAEHNHVSYLGFIVHTPGNTSIDITDWINDIKWTSHSQPSPSEIFTLWCCEHGSYLCYDTENIVIEVITDDGETIKKGLNEFTNTKIQENVKDRTDRQDLNRPVDVILSSGGC